jgi:hypothetical protein
MTGLSRKRGTSILEAMVSLTLLSTVLSVSLPLVVRHGRLLVDQRDYRLALDELTNQLDRLTALPNEELAAELQNLAVSPFTADRLANARLHGELEPAEIGSRLNLRLTWGGREQHQVSLAGWSIPAAQPTGEPAASELSP